MVAWAVQVTAGSISCSGRIHPLAASAARRRACGSNRGVSPTALTRTRGCMEVWAMLMAELLIGRFRWSPRSRRFHLDREVLPHRMKTVYEGSSRIECVCSRRVRFPRFRVWHAALPPPLRRREAQLPVDPLLIANERYQVVSLWWYCRLRTFRTLQQDDSHLTRSRCPSRSER